MLGQQIGPDRHIIVAVVLTSSPKSHTIHSAELKGPFMKSNHKITPIQAFTDNYIWVIEHPQRAEVVVVDPGDATRVQAWCQQHQKSVHAILITHHHPDHSGGAPELASQWGCEIYGPKTLSCTTQACAEGNTLSLWPGLTLRTMEIPGHTLDHLAFYDDHVLFCGDTLFSGGCGRVFEGTYEQMLNSLNKIAALPDDLLIYSGHEYTEDNLHFALEICEPNNQAIKNRLNTLPACTLPTRLSEERKINPFLRLPQLKKHGHEESELALFTKIRKRKDAYQAPKKNT